MNSSRNRGLLMASLVLAWFGAFAAADAIGQGWGAAVPLAVAAIPMAIVYYVWGGRDSDFTALLIGRRADERQALVRTRARALAGNAMYAAAPISGIAALALPDTGGWGRNWPFAVVVTVGTISYWCAGRASGLRVLIGRRADERQALIRTRARALAGNAMYAAAAIGAAVELALRDAQHRGSYWSFSLVAVAGGVACLVGLRRYGDHDEGEGMEQRAPEPILTWWGGNRRTASAPDRNRHADQTG
ncbi:MAG: hypothetical protein ACLP52_15510 [Streptosporangiaceae bacterium]